MDWLPGLRFDRLIQAEIFDDPSGGVSPYSTDSAWARRVRRRMKSTLWRHREERTTDAHGLASWRICYERVAFGSGDAESV